VGKKIEENQVEDETLSVAEKSSNMPKTAYVSDGKRKLRQRETHPSSEWQSTEQVTMTKNSKESNLSIWQSGEADKQLEREAPDLVTTAAFGANCSAREAQSRRTFIWKRAAHKEQQNRAAPSAIRQRRPQRHTQKRSEGKNRKYILY
jgi:hypothetical protein